MGVVAPLPGFNAGLAELAHRHGALLIIDEVMTGFRVSRSGWQGLEPVDADLWTFGKVMGGGLPAAAFGGRARHHGEARPGRAGLPGRHAVGQPAGLRGRAGLAAAGRRRDLRQARRDRRDDRGRWPPGRWPRPGCRTGWPPRATCSRSSSRAGEVTNYDEAKKQDVERVPSVLPQHAGAGRLPAAERLRGVVRQHRHRRRGAGAGSPRRPVAAAGRRRQRRENDRPPDASW